MKIHEASESLACSQKVGLNNQEFVTFRVSNHPQIQFMYEPTRNAEGVRRQASLTPPSKVRPLERVDFRCARLQAGLAVRAGRQGRLTRITAQTCSRSVASRPLSPSA